MKQHTAVFFDVAKHVVHLDRLADDRRGRIVFSGDFAYAGDGFTTGDGRLIFWFQPHDDRRSPAVPPNQSSSGTSRLNTAGRSRRSIAADMPRFMSVARPTC